MKIFFWSFLVALSVSCGAQSSDEAQTAHQPTTDTSAVEVQEQPLFSNEYIGVGAAQLDHYLTDLENKRVGVVGNQSSLIGSVHLVDTLIALKVDIVKVFSPEHGFRGKADAGEKVQDGVDGKTGLPIISLYGKNKKPKPEQINDLDVLIFDIQDVGARFYTYISTLNYVMEAAAENGVDVIVLDRPNPNGHYVDGPVLDKAFDSFVGMNEVPVVHGMTIGEYAQMVKGEEWINLADSLNLKVVKCQNYTHNDFYELTVAPSPNLPNMKSVYLYPSLCFFEGTIVSVGRGTDLPFQCVGHPDFEVDVLEDLYKFKPEPNEGSKYPKLENEWCYGYDLSKDSIQIIREQRQLNLSHLIEFYDKIGSNDFFLSNNFFNLLAGNDLLMQQIKDGQSEDEIRVSWEEELSEFKLKRKKYLLYEDFE